MSPGRWKGARRSQPAVSVLPSRGEDTGPRRPAIRTRRRSFARLPPHSGSRRVAPALPCTSWSDHHQPLPYQTVRGDRHRHALVRAGWSRCSDREHRDAAAQCAASQRERRPPWPDRQPRRRGVRGAGRRLLFQLVQPCRSGPRVHVVCERDRRRLSGDDGEDERVSRRRWQLHASAGRRRRGLQAAKGYERMDLRLLRHPVELLEQHHRDPTRHLRRAYAGALRLHRRLAVLTCPGQPRRRARFVRLEIRVRTGCGIHQPREGSDSERHPSDPDRPVVVRRQLALHRRCGPPAPQRGSPARPLEGMEARRHASIAGRGDLLVGGCHDRRRGGGAVTERVPEPLRTGSAISIQSPAPGGVRPGVRAPAVRGRDLRARVGQPVLVQPVFERCLGDDRGRRRPRRSAGDAGAPVDGSHLLSARVRRRGNRRPRRPDRKRHLENALRLCHEPGADHRPGSGVQRGRPPRDHRRHRRAGEALSGIAGAALRVRHIGRHGRFTSCPPGNR